MTSPFRHSLRLLLVLGRGFYMAKKDLVHHALVLSLLLPSCNLYLVLFGFLIGVTSFSIRAPLLCIRMVREQFASYYNLFVLIKHFPPKDSLKKKMNCMTETG